MNEPVEGAPPSGYQAAPTKRYVWQQPETEAFMVELAQWKRLQGRVRGLEDEPKPTLLLTAGWSALSVSLSAALAVVVLPDHAQLASGVRPALWAITAAAAVLGVVLLALYRFWASKRFASEATDIANEMDTIHEAWREREPHGPIAAAPHEAP